MLDSTEIFRSDKAEIIARVCAAAQAGNLGSARETISAEYPFGIPQTVVRRYTDTQALTVFKRDSFTDRFTGQRLVFPGTLRLLSLLLPREFPYHRNWKV